MELAWIINDDWGRGDRDTPSLVFLKWFPQMGIRRNAIVYFTQKGCIRLSAQIRQGVRRLWAILGLGEFEDPKWKFEPRWSID